MYRFSELSKTNNDIQNFINRRTGECSASVVECLTRDEGPRVRASPASLRCGP